MMHRADNSITKNTAPAGTGEDTTEPRLVDALRQSLLVNKQLKQQNQYLTQIAHEPIAIISMGCRLPGGIHSPEQLWQQLSDGKETIGPFPVDRNWDIDAMFAQTPDLMAIAKTWQGGFLADAAGFDASFFKISDREALAMDPQQRILLEISWEILERASIVPASLKNSQTGVFIGTTHNGYISDIERRNPAADGYRLQGSLSSISSGRIAYVLGLNGPAVTVDTACSSSLTAIHQAISSLRNRECSLAIAGGATIMASPDVFAEFTRQGGLAADGRCKAFSDAADGTGFSEGAGLILLERLSDAVKSNHTVLAVIRGSAINQDGASNGLTAPSSSAQEQVIRQALNNAELTFSDIDVVEAHGTGTSLGDPIEAHALLNTYGKHRTEDKPLWLGSLKSNIGHVQLAAGVASVIKMVMALQHEQLPKTLHAETPSSKIDWSRGNIKLLDAAINWPDSGRPKRAAVSAFGFSGTNAHLILEEAPLISSSEKNAATENTFPVPGISLPLSAASPSGLCAQARQLQSWISREKVSDLSAVAYSLATHRTHFDYRAVVTADNRDGILDALEGLADNRYAPGVIQGVRSRSGNAAFLFTGQGAQWPTMGQGLYRLSPVFAQTLDEICQHIDPLLPQPLKTVMFAEKDTTDAALLNRTDFTQAALFAFEVALCRTVMHLGVLPDVMVGHSIGEIAAAHIAGVFNLSDAATFVATRGKLMQSIAADGAMVAIEVSEAEILTSLEGCEDSVAVAAVNTQSSVVISGDTNIVLSIAEQWRDRGCRTHRLKTSHAFHSPHIDSITSELQRTLSTLAFHTPAIPIVSTVTGTLLSNEQACSAEYWANQARSAVRFDAAIQWLQMHNTVVSLEVGPDGVLTALGRASTATDAHDLPGTVWVASLRKDRDESRPFFAALAQLYAQGQPLDWTKLLPPAPPAALPTYPFQRRRYWLQAPERRPTFDGGLFTVNHPFLHAGISLANQQGWIFTGQLDAAKQPWLLEHVVGDVAAVAGTVTAELMLFIGELIGCQRMDELSLHTILPLEKQAPAHIQLRIGELDASGGRQAEAYFSIPDPTQPAELAPVWQRYATCHLVPDNTSTPEWPDLHSPNWPPSNAEPVDFSPLYEQLAEKGVVLGESFQQLTHVWEDDDNLYVEATLPPIQGEQGEDFILHPTILDAGMQAALIEKLNVETDNNQPRLLFFLSGLRTYAKNVHRLRGHLVRKPSTSSALGYREYSLRLADDTGRAVAVVDSMVLKSSSTQHSHTPQRPPFYRLLWREVEPIASPTSIKPLWMTQQDSLQPCLSDITKENASLIVYTDIDHALACFAPEPEHVAMFIVPNADNSDVYIDHHPTRHVLSALQTWLNDARTTNTPLIVVTQNAVATREDESVPNLAQSPIWGLIRTAQLEYPSRFFLLDIDDIANASWSLISTAIHALPHTLQLAVRAGRIFTPRLVKAAGDGDLSAHNDTDQQEKLCRNLKPGGTVLITGGTGALGRAAARHLVECHGVRHLLLVSRRGIEAPGADALREELAELGAQATFIACNVADPQAVESLLNAIPKAHPLTAIIHTAGTVDTSSLDSMTAEQVDSVLQSKAVSAWNLHQLSLNYDLSAFVLYSSAVSILPQKAQGNYAAANAFLDALAHYRRHLGLPATAMAWGMWAERSEMGEQLGSDDIQRIIDTGQNPLSRTQGLAFLDTVVGTEVVEHAPLLIPARLNLEALRDQHAPSLLTEVLPRRSASQSAPAPSLQLAEMPEKERLPYLLNVIIQSAGEVLNHPEPKSIRSNEEFISLGFDSLTSVEMGSRLSLALGVRLPATAIFEHSTPQALAQFLLSLVFKSMQDPSEGPHIEQQKTKGGLFQLLRKAVEQGMTNDGLSVLAGAARLRKHFSHLEHNQYAPEGVWLGREREKPLLICLNSFIPAAANLTYQRLNSALCDRYSLLTIPLPGYDTSPLPATDYAAAAALATAVERGSEGRDFTLVGFSTGGLVAHATAHQLEARGRPAKSVVLIDSFPPSAMSEDAMGDVLKTWFTAKGEFWTDEDNAMMAMSWYLELFGLQWTPAHLKTPTFMLQAADYPASAQPTQWANEWPNLVKSVITPGSHFELLTEYVAQTAENLSALLNEITPKTDIKKALLRPQREAK